MIRRLVIPGPIEDVEEFRVLEWHRAEGGSFAAGELLVEVETQKAIIEVWTETAGVLRRILSRAGEWQKLDRPLALVSDAPDEEVPAEVPAGAPALDVVFEVN